MATDSEVLGSVSLFALLDAQERAALAERLDVTTFAAGAVVFNAGDPGDALYVVRSGEVEIFFRNDSGDRIVLERARAGDFFGEISLLDGGPCWAASDSGSRGRRRPSPSKGWRRWSIPFLLIHCVLFFLWIVVNVGPLARTRIGGWDPFPFGLLTMAVSLEAIILSVFVLLSQNRQVERDRARNEIEYDVNLKAELEVAHLLEKVDDMHGELLGRLQRIETALSKHPPEASGMRSS